MDLLQFQQNLLGIDVWEILRPILEKHFSELEELIRKQLSEGIKGDGSAMPDYKEDSYADFKDKYVDTYNIYPTTDLRYEGNFYKQIKARFDLFGIETESFDYKAGALEKKYGSEIYELTNESLNKWIDMWINEFFESFENAILKD